MVSEPVSDEPASGEPVSDESTGVASVRPGGAALCPGTVIHSRRTPTEHRFTYPVSLLWIDADDPGNLFDRHPAWATTRPAPVRFRRRDYLDGGTGPIGDAVRRLVAKPLGYRPDGPVRMLTQPRTWGWLFNPITIYLLWANADGPPVAAVLEVTNTPWKERTAYPVVLEPTTGDDGRSGFGARFNKSLHVSPFLDEDYAYRLFVDEHSRQSKPSRLTIDLDVEPSCIQPPDPNGGDVKATNTAPVLTTRLVVERVQPTRRAMTTSLLTNPFPTHKVSFGIHRQALTLWRKRVPFVAHPAKRGNGPSRTDHLEEPADD